MSNPKLRRLYAQLVFYPTLAWNALLGRILSIRQWWNHVDDHVIVGAYPFARDVPAMHKAGVKAVVNTCEEYAGPTGQYSKHEIEQLRIPTTDFTHPKLEDVQKAVEFVEKHAAQERTVYIHCKAGRARSATIAMCWLMKYRGMTMQQAQGALLKARHHINPRLTERPVVHQFAEANGLS